MPLAPPAAHTEGANTVNAAHLDHPGDMHWVTGHGPQPVTGPCTHDCTHTHSTWIAYGPDLEHYTLNQCDQCACRAWHNDTGKHRTRWLAHNGDDIGDSDTPTHWV